MDFASLKTVQTFELASNYATQLETAAQKCMQAAELDTKPETDPQHMISCRYYNGFKKFRAPESSANFWMGWHVKITGN